MAPHVASFAGRVSAWQRQHGRHDLPWQATRDAYRVWLSEVMLQQTQVATALPYYERFVARFPDVAALAAAARDDVLAAWSGLGYYRRAHHLHEAARTIVERHGGVLPNDVDTLASLPGIGRSTAAAIAAFAHGRRAAILDGNVKRVLARHRGIDGYPGVSAVERRLWQAAESLLPEAGIEAYTQGLMDLGATVCVRTAPECLLCPVAHDCVARIEGRIDVLPAPRPPRKVRQRAVQLLVVEHEGRVLLERRAPTGVWSGLWSLPEAALDETPAEAARSRLGLDTMEGGALPPLVHAFTHFTLTMHPRRLIACAGAGVASDQRRWVDGDAAQALALPAPIRRLLASLAPASR